MEQERWAIVKPCTDPVGFRPPVHMGGGHPKDLSSDCRWGLECSCCALEVPGPGGRHSPTEFLGLRLHCRGASLKRVCCSPLL